MIVCELVGEEFKMSNKDPTKTELGCRQETPRVKRVNSTGSDEVANITVEIAILSL